ncbi:DUF2239 family protein [Methylobacterium frigidaeris]|uniref:DUF2239 domain-containing protein n=1 Tax=Methylobacterium frigidaeris TaxID=2038277 RepID=A0AA37M7R0_9HYPH|nr:DUF2239 family protein [Methylobacterium frigidaeris]PIK71305.1 hypothetical protein CS379_20075 [Methylobacterium frigidaeris]GJD64946.1 hypothetical protein MPEAHAMD_5132 [Methylobacterium frigidaeris]
MDEPFTCTAFEGGRRLAAGPAAAVALAVKRAAERGISPLVFDDRSGRQIDFDLRGSDAEVTARLDPPARPAGRPKLGVVAREVTLLPRHWDWLAAQPGGASVALRKLVEAARSADSGGERRRLAQEAADRFMGAMLGDAPGYEEASRALYAGDADRFQTLSEDWPVDLRDHARRLAGPAFEGETA